MKGQLTPCLCYNNQAAEAARLYSSVFEGCRIISENSLVAEIEVSGQIFILLNAGPQFKPNPSISFYYICETENELIRIWNAFTEKGKVMMALDKYPWGEKYGWVSDKFGISWQLSLGKISDVGQKITPCLLFTQEQFGKVEEAIAFYSSGFKNSSIDGVLKWTEQEGKELAGKVKHAQIVLDGSKMMMMESLGHDFTFSEGVSLTIYCHTQDEIDYYWEKLTSGGKESMCGWLEDRFGVSWQVTPAILPELMRDPVKAPRAMQAFMPMKKLNIETILRAANG